MKHIAIFNNSGDVRTALDEQTLLKPYVALVSGSLDYNSVEPTPECYVEDSDGNIYLPASRTEINQEITYYFSFQADVDATWTLYRNKAVVVATEGGLYWNYICNSSHTQFETISAAGMPIADIAPTSPASYDEPVQKLSVLFVVGGEGTNSINANITIPYCGGSPTSSSSSSS